MTFCIYPVEKEMSGAQTGDKFDNIINKEYLP